MNLFKVVPKFEKKKDHKQNILLSPKNIPNRTLSNSDFNPYNFVLLKRQIP